MRLLEDRHEIAMAINFRQMPVIEIDLSKRDDYGYVGTFVNIEHGGSSSPVRARLRSYDDTNYLEFCTFGICLSASFGYHDIREMLDYANAPTVKPDQDILIVFTDTEKQVAYKPVVLHTGSHVDAFCQTPMELEKFHLLYERGADESNISD